jgi:quercetin dioxygenase-like cupin family protein
MAIPHAAAGVPVDLLSREEPTSPPRTIALVKNNEFEAIRMAIPAGHEVCSNHSVDGPLTLQVLAGQIAFSVDGDTHAVRTGEWLYLPGGVSHSVAGVEDSLVLLTIMFR